MGLSSKTCKKYDDISNLKVTADLLYLLTILGSYILKFFSLLCNYSVRLLLSMNACVSNWLIQAQYPIQFVIILHMNCYLNFKCFGFWNIVNLLWMNLIKISKSLALCLDYIFSKVTACLEWFSNCEILTMTFCEFVHCCVRS